MCVCVSVCLSVTGISALQVKFKCSYVLVCVQCYIFLDLNLPDFEIKLGSEVIAQFEGSCEQWQDNSNGKPAQWITL